MAKDSGRLGGRFEAEESGGLSGLLAEEDEFDRRTLWRLGTWAAVSVGAVILAVVTNQSSIDLRHEQSASADLIKQARQIQLAAKEGQNEARRLASAVDTLNSDRDRLYSRVAVLEQGLNSVTGTIARQAPATPTPQASTGPAGTSQQTSASTAPPTGPSTPSQASAASPAPASTASTVPAVVASVDPPAAAAKPTPAAPVLAPVAAIAPASDKPDKVGDKQEKAADKKDKQAAQAAAAAPSEPSPGPATKSAVAQPSAPAQPQVSLIASKSMMAPPDSAAGKLLEPVTPLKTVMSALMPEIAAVAPRASEETEPAPAVPAPTVQRTEFGVDVGGANSVTGLRALWRGLLKSRSNAALTKLRPIIVIKENNNGLGMQLRLVAGPISDAAAAAKICASVAVNDRGCSTTVFEGQRLVLNADEQSKVDTKTTAEAAPDSKPEPAPKVSFHRRYVPRHPPKEEDPPPPPKPEPSTLSLIFGKH